MCISALRASEAAQSMDVGPGSNVRGGIGSIFHHPIGRKNTALGLPGIVLAFVWGLYNPKPTYHQNNLLNKCVGGDRHGMEI